MIINSSVHESATLFKDVIVKNSKISKNASIGDFTKIKNCQLYESVIIDRNNHVDSSTIGRFSYTGKNSLILHADIGCFCPISWNVSIGGADHDYSRMTQHSFLYNSNNNLRPADRDPAYDRYLEQVRIGNDVWIAAGAVITRGVSIGDGAVIGANAVVTRDIPPYAIAVGLPAKVIKYRFSDEIIELMMQLKWWQWSEDKIRRNFDIVSKPPEVNKLKELLYENSL